MPDFTYEFNWRCSQNQEKFWAAGAEPPCDWDERYNSEGLRVIEVTKNRFGVIEARCPKCGELCVMDKHAV